MRFAYYIIVIPILALVAWLLYGIEVSEAGISFFPWSQEYVNPQVVLVACILLGYMVGKINSWFNYLPLRRDLKLQKKANKALNLEQEKLNTKVNDLKQNIIGLQEQVQSNVHADVVPEKKNLKSWFSGVVARLGLNKGK